MANDFRTNIDAPDVAWCQDRRPNAEPLVVWLATEPVPRVAIVTTRAVSHGEEITMDYGAQYWLRRAEPQLRSILRVHPSGRRIIDSGRQIVDSGRKIVDQDLRR